MTDSLGAIGAIGKRIRRERVISLVMIQLVQKCRSRVIMYPDDEKKLIVHVSSRYKAEEICYNVSTTI